MFKKVHVLDENELVVRGIISQVRAVEVFKFRTGFAYLKYCIQIILIQNIGSQRINQIKKLNLRSTKKSLNIVISKSIPVFI